VLLVLLVLSTGLADQPAVPGIVCGVEETGLSREYNESRHPKIPYKSTPGVMDRQTVMRS
jgi:hypothetical protein